MTILTVRTQWREALLMRYPEFLTSPFIGLLPFAAVVFVVAVAAGSVWIIRESAIPSVDLWSTLILIFSLAAGGLFVSAGRPYNVLSSFGIRRRYYEIAQLALGLGGFVWLIMAAPMFRVVLAKRIQSITTLEGARAITAAFEEGKKCDEHLHLFRSAGGSELDKACTPERHKFYDALISRFSGRDRSLSAEYSSKFAAGENISRLAHSFHLDPFFSPPLLKAAFAYVLFVLAAVYLGPAYLEMVRQAFGTAAMTIAFGPVAKDLTNVEFAGNVLIAVASVLWAWRYSVDFKRLSNLAVHINAFGIFLSVVVVDVGLVQLYQGGQIFGVAVPSQALEFSAKLVLAVAIVSFLYAPAARDRAVRASAQPESI